MVRVGVRDRVGKIKISHKGARKGRESRRENREPRRRNR